MDLTDFYRVFHPNIKEYTSIPAPRGTFSNTDHIISNKSNLKNCKKNLIPQYILLDHHGLKLEVNSNTNSRKLTNARELNNAHLSHQWVIEEMSEIKVFL